MVEELKRSSEALDVQEKLDRAERAGAPNASRRRYLLELGAAVAALAGCSEGAAKAPRTGSARPTTSNPNAHLNGDGNVSTSAAIGAIGGGLPAANGTMFTTLPGVGVRLSVRDDGEMAMPGAPVFPLPTTTMSDGKTFPVWGLVEQDSGLGFNGTLISPGPVLEMTEGVTASVKLTAMMAHTLHWHGMDVPTAVDGDPDTSGWVGMMPSARISPTAKKLGMSFTYSFVAPSAGTYYYHCHVDTVVHMELGMMGAVVVRPPGGSKTQLYADGPLYDAEFLWQLHTMDSTWHVAGHIESGPAQIDYNPDYFLINGMDGIALLADKATAISGSVGQTILVRLVNFGFLTAEVWLGGVIFKVVMSDGRKLARAFETDTLLMGAGERYDVFIRTTDATTVSPEVRYYNAMGTRVLGKAITSLTIS